MKFEKNEWRTVSFIVFKDGQGLTINWRNYIWFEITERSQKILQPWSFIVPMSFVLQTLFLREQKQNTAAETDWKHSVALSHQCDLTIHKWRTSAQVEKILLCTWATSASTGICWLDNSNIWLLPTIQSDYAPHLQFTFANYKLGTLNCNTRWNNKTIHHTVNNWHFQNMTEQMADTTLVILSLILPNTVATHDIILSLLHFKPWN